MYTYVYEPFLRAVQETERLYTHTQRRLHPTAGHVTPSRSENEKYKKKKKYIYNAPYIYIYTFRSV